MPEMQKARHCGGPCFIGFSDVLVGMLFGFRRLGFCLRLRPLLGRGPLRGLRARLIRALRLLWLIVLNLRLVGPVVRLIGASLWLIGPCLIGRL